MSDHGPHLKARAMDLYEMAVEGGLYPTPTDEEWKAATHGAVLGMTALLNYLTETGIINADQR